MALTVRKKLDQEIGGTAALVTGEIDFDSSYPTGGEAFAIPGHGSWQDCIVQSKAGYVFAPDETNQKLLVYRQKDPANAGGADIPLVEVADTTSLATLTKVSFHAIVSD